MRLIMVILALSFYSSINAQCDVVIVKTQAELDTWIANWAGTCTQVTSLAIGEPNEFSMSDIDDLSGLSFLTSVTEHVHVRNCPDLTTLAGLQNIDFIGTDLWLLDLTSLEDMTALEGITNIPGDLNVQYCDSLVNLNGLNNISSVGGDLRIEFNDKLMSAAGLEAVTSVGNVLSLRGNVSLEEISDLGNISGTVYDLQIWGNDVLENVDGLTGISMVENDCRIKACPLLANLNGLSGLSYVGDELELGGLAITNLAGLSMLITVDGEFEIQDNANLTSLDGVEQLTIIGGPLDIWENYSLGSLTGLQNVSSVGGFILINQADSLTDLSGLENLLSVDGYLEISRNASLSSLDGIENVATVGSNITIGFNPNLSFCAIASVCAHIQSGGESFIYNNAAGCLNVPEVTAACDADVCSSFNTTTAVVHTSCGISNGEATVIATGGTPPYEYAWSTGDNANTISNLPAGMYWVTVTDAENCTSEEKVTIDSSLTVTGNVHVTLITCAGVCDGAIDVLNENGTPPYVYLWSTAETTSSISGLCPGTYSVTVSDANGCTVAIEVDISEPDSVDIELLAIQHITNDNPGSIEIGVTGGTPGYTYNWTGPNGYNATTQNIADLIDPGCYIAEVTDMNNCAVTSDTLCIEDQTSAITNPLGRAFKIYPNPVIDKLNIELSNQVLDYDCLLFDPQGKLLGNYNNPGVIDMSQHAPGVYMLNVRVEGVSVLMQKVVVGKR